MTLGVKNGASIVLDLSLLNAGTLYINPGNGEYETMDIQNTQWTGDKTIVAKGETITLHGNINKFYANSNGENLNAIDVTRLLDLEWLELDGNNLSEINVDQNKKLARLYFSWNKVKELNIDGYPNLLRFYCRHNEMTSLTLGNTPKLYTAYCDGNLLDACALDDLYTSLSDGTAQYEKNFFVQVSATAYDAGTNPGIATSDTKIATDKNWRIRDYSPEGEVDIHGDGTGCDSSGNIEISQTNFRMFPNPASDEITIESREVITKVELTDINGKMLTTRDNLSADVYTLDLRQYTTGVYLLRVTTSKGIATEKVVIN